MPGDAADEDEPQFHFVEATAPTPPATSGTELIHTSRRLALLDHIAPHTWLIAAVVAALAIGLGAGYAIGRHDAPTRLVRVAPTPTSSSPAFEPVQALALTGARCAVQHGRQLDLGLEVTNNSSTAVTLVRTTTHQPLGGLIPIRSIRGSCSQLISSVGDIDGYELRPGATVWLTLTFQVLVRCPQPLPVQIDVDYLRGGSRQHVDLGGFSDLGDVPYSGCTSS